MERIFASFWLQLSQLSNIWKGDQNSSAPKQTSEFHCCRQHKKKLLRIKLRELSNVKFHSKKMLQSLVQHQGLPNIWNKNTRLWIKLKRCIIRAPRKHPARSFTTSAKILSSGGGCLDEFIYLAELNFGAQKITRKRKMLWKINHLKVFLLPEKKPASLNTLKMDAWNTSLVSFWGVKRPIFRDFCC